MGRPCEEVIVISDQEEGEIIDSDFWCQSPQPDSTVPAPSLPHLSFLPPVPPPKEEPPRRRRRYSALTPLYCYKYRDRYVRTTRVMKRRLLPRSKLKSTRKKRLPESSTDSELETINSELTKLAVPKKSNPITSLRSRLSNMMKIPIRKRKLEQSPLKDDLLENLSSDDDLGPTKKVDKTLENVSDDDIEILRELALKSKTIKQNQTPLKEQTDDNKSNKSDVDDDEMLQLRMAALKSAIIKKAKKRVKKKRDKPIENEEEYGNYMFNVSDPLYLVEEETKSELDNQINQNDDLDEDEELLRSNLLASMKARVSPATSNIKTDSVEKSKNNGLIVRLGGSDSESECEATKNLVVMHKKLTEQSEFQRNLDLYLKSARMVIADRDPSRPDSSSPHLQRTDSPVSPIIKNLTPSDQQEYQKLILRMQELENSKMKTITANDQSSLPNVQNKKGLIQILGPSTFVNGNTNHSTGVHEEKGNERSFKVFEQHLNFIRRKISSYSMISLRQKTEINTLKVKKNNLLKQMKSMKIVLQNIEKSLIMNQNSKLINDRQLSRLYKQQMVLLNHQIRFPKSVPKRSIENNPPVPSINSSTNEIALDSNKDNPKTENSRIRNISVSIINKDDGERQVHIENGDKDDRMDYEENMEKVDINIINHSNDNTPLLVTISDKKVLNESKSKSVGFMEYDSTILGMTSSQSWSYDPSGILCPFDVSGNCRDASCTYIHTHT